MKSAKTVQGISDLKVTGDLNKSHFTRMIRKRTRLELKWEVRVEEMEMKSKRRHKEGNSKGRELGKIRNPKEVYMFFKKYSFKKWDERLVWGLVKK